MMQSSWTTFLAWAVAIAMLKILCRIFDARNLRKLTITTANSRTTITGFNGELFINGKNIELPQPRPNRQLRTSGIASSLLNINIGSPSVSINGGSHGAMTEGSGSSLHWVGDKVELRIEGEEYARVKCDGEEFMVKI